MKFLSLCALLSASSVLAEFDLFNANHRSALKDSIEAQKNKDESVRSRHLTEQATAGGTCRSDEDCSSIDGFSCSLRRCLPTAESCMGKAVGAFRESFDADGWLETNYANANVTQDSLIDAATAAGTYDDFQSSGVFLALVGAASSNIPDQVNELAEAVSSCNSVAVLAAGTEERAPSEEGTISYLGIHMELSAIADIAMSVFWTVGEEAEGKAPDQFIRGTFGVEAGLGAEVSMLIGFAFTGTPLDILGESVIVDADAGLGPAAGMAVVAHLRSSGGGGATSLEFTLGAGAGGGLGVGYGITAALPLDSVEPGWYFAELGESCDDACERNSLEGACNEDRMNEVDTEAIISDIVEEESDFTCGTFTNIADPSAPLISVDKAGTNVVVCSVSKGFSECDATKDNDIRLCCCGLDEDCPLEY